MNINSILRYSSFGAVLKDLNVRIDFNLPQRASVNKLPVNDASSSDSTENNNTYYLSDNISISDEAKYLNSRASSSNTSSASDSDTKEIQELEKLDKEVRQHEMEHKRAAGQYASQPVYTYKTGPDGKRYAVDGHVQIDTSEEETPEETLRKAELIQRAAQAPSDPSAQDIQVAQQAEALAQEARNEMKQYANATNQSSPTISKTSDAHFRNAIEMYTKDPSPSSMLNLVA